MVQILVRWAQGFQKALVPEEENSIATFTGVVKLGCQTHVNTENQCETDISTYRFCLASYRGDTKSNVMV